MMAVDLHNRDSLLLPCQCFNENSNSNDNNNNILSMNTNQASNQSWSSCFSNSSDFGSDFSSPVESELGSTESDSDQEDEYIAELTRQMAHYMLQDEEDRHEKKAWSQEEVLMMGKFENLKKNEEKHVCYNGVRFAASSFEPTSVPLSMKEPKSSNLEFQSRQALIDYQIRAIQLYKLKQEQINIRQQQESLYWGKQGNQYKQIELKKQQVKQFHQNKGRTCSGFVNGQQGSWANLQQKQRTGSEMTAFFLGETGSRSGSCGTGVFLPKGINNTCQSRKKPGCSTVLIPARVVQALKLHFDKMGIESRPNGASFPVQFQQHDGIMEDMRCDLQSKKKNQSKTMQAMNNNQEMVLPQEWTY